MSFVRVTPDVVTSAATDLESIGSALSAANAAAVAPTTGVPPMAADEVSAAVQSVFATYAHGYQTVSAQAAAVHSKIVRLMNSSAVAYAEAELTNVQQALSADAVGIQRVAAADAVGARRVMRADVGAMRRAVAADAAVARADLVKAVNAPARVLLGRPLIETGTAPRATGVGFGQGTGGTPTTTTTNTGGGSGTGNPSGGSPNGGPSGTTPPNTGGYGNGTATPTAPAKADTGTGTGLPVAKAGLVTTTATMSQSSAATVTATTSSSSGSSVTTGTSGVVTGTSTPVTGSGTGTGTGVTITGSGTGVTVTGGGNGTGTVVTGTGTGTTVTGTISSGSSPLPVPELDLKTPFGPVQVTLYHSMVTNGMTVWSGSVSLPPSLVSAVDALGAQASATSALHADITAFTAAVQTGHPVAAVDALVRAPADVMNGYLYGQSSITETLPTPTGYADAYATVPVGGVLSPVRPLTVTLVPSTGSPTVVTLTGTEFGGIANALT